uniref:Uncharacterized protein n=1 Tax=Trypanosoma congolense (strain IL3000) TaxID=1068625 RepID=G0UMN5_TRYCI|nr:hypothetical protein, unlikely [Trypanosoma congolense IL3000]
MLNGVRQVSLQPFRVSCAACVYGCGSYSVEISTMCCLHQPHVVTTLFEYSDGPRRCTVPSQQHDYRLSRSWINLLPLPHKKEKHSYFSPSYDMFPSPNLRGANNMEIRSPLSPRIYLERMRLLVCGA